MKNTCVQIENGITYDLDYVDIFEEDMLVAFEEYFSLWQTIDNNEMTSKSASKLISEAQILYIVNQESENNEQNITK